VNYIGVNYIGVNKDQGGRTRAHGDKPPAPPRAWGQVRAHQVRLHS
jgi:hypothetical protein